MKNYLDSLNEGQLSAVTTKEQYARVIAGAGSGKTRVLTSRISFLIDELKILPYRILAFTFTNKAAKEMKDRVNKSLGNLSINNSNICTYHSFCNRLLREDIALIDGYSRDFTILDESDQADIVKIVKKDIDEFKQYKVNDLVGYISRCKTFNIVPKDALEDLEKEQKSTIPARIYLEYCKYLKSHNYVDFDDLLIFAVEILHKNEHVRTKWQDRYDAILVDEFQDTDNTQYELLKLLTKPSTSLFVVGDPDQTIYTWRGANIDIIFDFANDFKGVKDYFLNINYRSSSSILDCANNLIKNNKQRFDKDLVSANSEGTLPVIFDATSQEVEANYIASKIDKSIADYNLSYKDFAILYRSNYYSGMIERALINLRIPYEIYGNYKFYERKEVKDAMSYLRLICSDDDIVAFARIINVPRRGVGAKTLDEIVINSKEEKISAFQYLKKNHNIGNCKDFIELIDKFRERLNEKNVNFADFLRDLLEESGYMKILDPIDDQERIENVHELGNILFNAQISDPDISLSQVINDLTLYSSQDSIKDDNVVKLMTIHTAKGLEFPYVFVAGLCNGVFPTNRAINAKDSRKALEEERRLAYVAFTRAKNNLFLTYNTGFSYVSGQNLGKSIFIDEIGSKAKFNDKPVYENKYINNISNNKLVKKTPLSNNFTNITGDYRPGTMVNHCKYGKGIVLSVDEEYVTIAFEDADVNVKTISKTFNGLTRI